MEELKSRMTRKDEEKLQTEYSGRGKNKVIKNYKRIKKFKKTKQRSYRKRMIDLERKETKQDWSPREVTVPLIRGSWNCYQQKQIVSTRQ